MSSAEQVFRWGILGPGDIARRFAAGLVYCAKPARLTAVGSRSPERGAAFAREFGAERSYGSYEELAEDDELDAVYIATPHSEHAGNALLCLERGRNVLVEKPFTLNAAEAERVIGAARQRGLFCMEAMWTRFFPATRKLREFAVAGAVGRLRLVTADFGFRTEFLPEHRLFDPTLGGGGLLDVGIYPVSFSSMLLGSVAEASAAAELAASGVDELAAITLRHASGGVSLLSCATRLNTARRAAAFGEDGSLELGGEWWKPDSVTIRRGAESSGLAESLPFPYPGTGFQFEADEVRACLEAGTPESETMQLDETLMLMRTLDTLRKQIGVYYQADSAAA